MLLFILTNLCASFTSVRVEIWKGLSIFTKPEQYDHAGISNFDVKAAQQIYMSNL